MKTWMTLLTIASALLLSCNRDDEGEENPWPVWILQVTVNDFSTHSPVLNCARVVWNYSGSGDNHVTSCADHDPDEPHYVKVWKSFGDAETVSINYHVECDGYFESDGESVFFDRSLAQTLPNHPGDEVIEDVSVSLTPR